MNQENEKRILLVANTARFFVLFEQNDIRLLQSMGYQVHCASNFEHERDVDAKTVLAALGVCIHQIDIARSPVSFGNFHAYCQLVSLMKGTRFDAVHCHTPMGSVLARLAAKQTGVSPVIYTVHGLHFYKGCKIQNRIFYEPIERWLARYTDILITINEEDYQTVQTFHLRGKAYKVPGVGIDVKKISGSKIDRKAKRSEIGIPEQAVVIISVGDLIKRKNHIVALHAFAKAAIPNSYYILCGDGEERGYLQNEAERLGVHDSVIFMGYRHDIQELLQIADIFCFPSLQEGLPVALMEAMATGLPCVAAKIRGDIDLLGESYAYLFQPNDEDTLSVLLHEIVAAREEAGVYCFDRIKQFDLTRVTTEMNEIYDHAFKKRGGVQNLKAAQQFRKATGIPLDALLFISVGDLNENKNHAMAIEAFANANISNSYYLICGEGRLKADLIKQVNRLGMCNRVMFLGFREDVNAILKAADVFVFPSKREGLSVALMEAMAAGLPCVASRIRGNTDLLGNDYKYYFAPSQSDELAAMLTAICADRPACGQYCHERSKLFDICVVAEQMKTIYCQTLK